MFILRFPALLTISKTQYEKINDCPICINFICL